MFDIEKKQEEASNRLIQSKKSAAERMAKTGAKTRAPPPLPPDASTKEIKKREKSITGDVIVQRVMNDYNKRSKAGIEKYGTTIYPPNNNCAC